MARKGKRKSTRKFVTVEVQGPASWVEFKIPTWNESRDAVQGVRKDAKKYIRREVDKEHGVRIVPQEDVDVDEAETALVDMLWELASAKFVAWNWVDDDGELLPSLPEIDPGDLLGPEMHKILNIVQSLYGITDEDDEGKVRG